ncbi:MULTISPECIES: hypothetical protein [Chromobacterium]|uniref:Tle cognate immunity protein 4 C-terminal domain-containing protein n=2 Tax=Chromobacterium TaxID=535 RepID=A0ABS3GM89_9NEIS|nr:MULTISPECIES: hypothetical protein [Chromobacterium]AXT44958.1 hypothetical protein D1345_01520 [Chromobacterium rhizoryzae]MBK0414792.1 hypothetical protein [Chromobacterium haemolyticum]MBO0416171.1 hypothetical protein [Chromobacterium haemolyticum]MBO0499330.1 hypothetical protein [Chromobacterium haemolyticum]MDH0342606.1 hypothetical protein [Chromobacterium haemolyticum]
MKAWLSMALLAATAPALADEALTPQALEELVQCASFERYQALQPALLDVVFDKGPDWIRKNERASTLGVYAYDLKRPIRVFGAETTRLALHKEYVSVPLPSGWTMAEAASRLRLKRAPIKAAEQHYRFVGNDGPMLSAYEMPANPLAALLGAPQGEPLRYLGCSYNGASEETFLSVAAQADEMMQKARGDMERMLRDVAKPSEDQ